MQAPAWWQPLDLGDVASLLTGIITAVGILLAYKQLRHVAAAQRAQFLLNATERYFADDDVRALYYDIDYERFALTFTNGEPAQVQRGDAAPIRFVGSREERLLDGLLYTLDTIGRIVDLGVLADREAALFRFQAKRVFSNSAVQEYLTWLDGERARLGGESPAHQAARRLADGKNVSNS
jgi:hypothetical protein